ncbi:cytochrome P450 26A1 isoform X2 [Pantherophis guttatus]|uniref:Cytochrome P450 26A1 n=1 Tax=Pantherophis guttatus TaxID=94885 RepID=A0A6P9CT64_PANGU|nr:cytochrome P450 26A1 isoform X2 [Pantherophis guttatus]
MGFSFLLASALGTLVLVPLLLCLASVKLWHFYCLRGRDPACPLPLPPGTMGLPFLGETLQLVLQRRKFLSMKRRQYGQVYKTHLFGRPTVRVMGVENVRHILLGEHRLVAVHWPASVRIILGSGCLSNLHDGQHKHRKKVIMKAFSREALEHYTPVIQEEVCACLKRWLLASSASGSCLLVYPEVKRLMFRIAMRILLGFQPNEAGCKSEQQLVDTFEEMIRNLFSLPIYVPFSGLYKGLKARNVIHAKIEEIIRVKLAEKEPSNGYKDVLQLLIEHTQSRGEQLNMQGLLGNCSQEKLLGMEVLEQLKYTGCVVKETIRLSPPVPGGFRVALKTFELNGYQIPKGWNVIYSISDTHSVAELFTNKEEFNPDRFMAPFPEDASRFSFIPFGGGLRSCVGKEFAKLLLKIFTVELARNCDWQLLNGPPIMKTGPTVYPADNLPTKFTTFKG